MKSPAVAFCATLALLLAACRTASAQSEGLVPTYGARFGGPSVLLSNADGQSPYASIVRYEGRTQCTGVFLATLPSHEDPGSAPAYVISNGHSSDFPGSNDVLPDRPSPPGRRVLFNYFADVPGQQVAVAVSRIAYATMKGRDIAVLELASRHDDLIRRGFNPWSVAAEPPVRNEPVVVIGAPLMSGTATSFLRLAVCRVDIRTPVVLEYIWHWFDFHGNRCADIRPGSSGSPVISRLTGRVLGLLNTTTIGAVRDTECSLNHPCEPTLRGEISQPDTSYMTPVAGVDRCFDEDGRFKVLQPGCPLDPGVQMRPTPAFLGAENPRLDAVPIGQQRRRWNVTVAGPFPLYRHKVVSAAIGDCRDLRGYGAP